MAKAPIRYLHAIGGTLHYRRRVPEDLKPMVGKSEWIHALGLAVGQEAHAVRIVAEYNAAYAQFIANARVQKITGSLPTLVPAVAVSPAILGGAPQPQEPEPKPAVKLTEAYKYDLETHGGDRDEKVFRVSVESVAKLVGDPDILTMTPKNVQTWIQACTDKGQKPTTIKRRINALHAILARYFRDHEIERNNPFSNTRLKSSTSGKSDRLPFHRSHLKLIDHYFDNAPRLGEDVKVILSLIKHTGARSLEIGGLDAADLILDHDVPHLWIRNNRHRRIKTKGSERRLPLVGKAYEMAKAAKQRAPEGPLFPLPCHDTNSLSQRLNKLIRRSGVPKSSRLVVYSFRHTLEEAMRAAGVREHTQKRIMGHTDGSITGRYGAPQGMLEELRDALKSASLVLGKVDLSIYSDDERVG